MFFQLRIKGYGPFVLVFILSVLIFTRAIGFAGQAAVPSMDELNGHFDKHDLDVFKAPPKIYYPETWFHFIGGNVAKEGITADLEAIANAGISGVQLFHGQFGGPWPGVNPQIACLSPLWEDAVQHTAKECHRLGLRFTMQNCPGWAMSGGPWIKPANAMRHLVWSRTDIDGGGAVKVNLPVPQPSNESWRDYKDITVLAFPIPLDDTGTSLIPKQVKSNHQEFAWMDCLAGKLGSPINLPPSTKVNPNWLEVTFAEDVVIRTIEFSSVQGFNHHYCYEPGVTVTVESITDQGVSEGLLQVDMPQSSWQDDKPISFACDEVKGIKTYRIIIVNEHPMSLGSLRLLSASRKNNWESEAGWTLRTIVRTGENPKQSKAAFVDPSMILDITSNMDRLGHLDWEAAAGKWTILRIGHVNAGMKNGPAPAEGTGWECDKLSETGPNVHFAGYIGKFASKESSGKGLLNGMLLDSWECKTQTWTSNMENEFNRVSGYKLRKWLPAVFGYVISDPETTTRFLRDWRATINDLFANKFYGRMAELAKENGLTISYETAAGDIFPADILEYYKYADIPMCEFWEHTSDSFVGNINFKPVKPAASAARLYGKPRLAAEAFTSFQLTWDEHLRDLKETANVNCIEGVTHLVFHTYTHNPRTDLLPGTSFAGVVGSPFLRGQTWWKHMPEFTTYLARCCYMLERGKPVSDVLWYLGDEINHKPNQNAPFPDGYKYDYCNPDVLLNRLTVKNGKLVTPEGIGYRVLWLPDNMRMLPETLEKILSLVQEGATIIGNAPKGLATLTDVANAQKRLNTSIGSLWGDISGSGIRTVGKGAVVYGMPLEEALAKLKILPDVIGDKALWLHRKADNADWYYVCAPKGSGYDGKLAFHNTGHVELWDPLTGLVREVPSNRVNGYTEVAFTLSKAGSCFVVFQEKSELADGDIPSVSKKNKEVIPFDQPWELAFPDEWGAPSSIVVDELKAWKDLDITEEGKAFSGTAIYTMKFDAGIIDDEASYILDLGQVEEIAKISLNGKTLRTVWTFPYTIDLSESIISGINELSIEVTSTWYNRLVYDAGQPENKRKTWVINWPSKDAQLKETGLMGPVCLIVKN